jgi:hypothetical protein
MAQDGEPSAWFYFNYVLGVIYVMSKFIIPRAKRANEVSKSSERNGRKFTQKKIRIGVGGCRLSVMNKEIARGMVCFFHQKSTST